jgi:hypothetical protein
VDGLDVQLYKDYFESGLDVFGPYGGFPVPNNCCPDTVRGSCCIGDSNIVLSEANCAAAGGEYYGDGIICETTDTQGIGDVNDDGLVYTMADIFFLTGFVLYGEPIPPKLWYCDLNGDGYIDWLDVKQLACVTFGQCEPIILTEVDCCPSTVHGATCFEDTCWVLSPENADLVNGYYMGDGTTCDPDTCITCCLGVVGNVDCSEDEVPDISDITRLIDFLYISHKPLCCPGEADVDVSGGLPDISDITRLIDFLYLSHDPLATCP